MAGAAGAQGPYGPANSGAAGGPGAELPKLDDWKPGVAGEAVFTAEECDRILAYPGALQSGRVSGGKDQQDNRQCQVGWIRIDDGDYAWLFQKAAAVVQQVNKTSYKMNLFGYTEGIQLTRYDAGSFQNWHMDFGTNQYSIRKLTFVIQLSDPSDYEGGELEVLAYYEPFSFPKTRGTMILFPSYVLHRVKPLLSGTRYSLVGWVSGPHLR